MTLAIVYLLASAALGVVIVRAWDRSMAASEIIGSGILIGLAIPGIGLFALSIAQLRWQLLSLVVVQLIIAGIALAVASRKSSQSGPTQFDESWPATLIDLATFALLAGYVIVATNAPTPEADFVTIWGLKGKTFFVQRGVDWAFLSNPWNGFAHLDYPILLPLMFDSVALATGTWNERALGGLYPLFGAAALLIVRGAVSRATGSRLLGSTAAFAGVPVALSPYIGLGEGPLIAYGTAGLLMLRRGLVETDRHFVRFGAVMLGLAALVKNEGVSLALAAGVAVFLTTQNRRAILDLWPAFAIPLPWFAVRAVLNLSTDLAEGSVLERVAEHLANPGVYVEALMRYPAGNVPMWIGIVVALALGMRELLARERFLLLAIVIQYAFLIGAYLVTPHSIDWHVRWSWERVMNQMTLPLIVLAAISLAAYLRRGTAEASAQ